MTSRRFVLFALLVGGFLLSQPLPSAAQTAEGNAAKQFVTDLSTQAIAVMTGNGIPDAERVSRFRTLFIGSVDLPTIGKLVLARYWRVATPDQRAEFLKLFEDMLVLTWSQRFKDTQGQVTFQVIDAKPDVDNGILVDSRILRAGQQPVPVIWRLRHPDGTFRVIDLVIEGTSMVFTYREEYASVITQNGGRIDGLLDALRQKVAQLSQPQAGPPN